MVGGGIFAVLGLSIQMSRGGAASLSFIIAKDGEPPAVLERKVRNEPVEGLLITTAATLAIANLFDLSSISTMGGAGFLLIFASVNHANALLAKETKSLCWISVLGVALCLGALGSLLWQTLQDDPYRLWVLCVMIGLAFLVEATYRVMKRGILHLGHRVYTGVFYSLQP